MKSFLYHLHIFFSWVAKFLSSERHLHNARFARPHELKPILSSTLDGTSLLLGESRFNYVLAVKPTEARKQLGNVLKVGPSQCGKSTDFKIQLRRWSYSTIVNDIKKELSRDTAKLRAEFSDVYFFDPTGPGHHLDPLLGKNTEDEFYAAATHLLYKPNEGEGKAFTDRAINMLTQLFLASRIEGRSPLPYVREMVRLGLVRASQRLQAISPELATQFLEIDYQRADFGDRYLTSSWGTLSASMRPLLTETVVKSLAGADFNISDLMKGKKPVTIYLQWPERDLLPLQPLMKLMWGTFIEQLKTVYDNTQDANSQIKDINLHVKCHPVLLLIDEGGVTPIPELYNHMSTVNGRGISFMIAVQALSQLDALYGKYNAETILNNASKVFFRQESLSTAEYISKCLGYKSGFAHSENSHNGVEASKGLSEREIPLMTPQEIMQMSDEEILGFHRGLPPFQAKRMDWRRFPALTQRQRISPSQLSVLPELEDALAPKKGVVVGVDSGRLPVRLPVF